MATSDPPTAAASADPVPVGFRGALAGNAAERAIYAAALASKETRQTIGSGLARALLERLRHDHYHAVRRIAERGLSALPPGPAVETRRRPRAKAGGRARRSRRRDQRVVAAVRIEDRGLP